MRAADAENDVSGGGVFWFSYVWELPSARAGVTEEEYRKNVNDKEKETFLVDCFFSFKVPKVHQFHYRT